MGIWDNYHLPRADSALPCIRREFRADKKLFTFKQHPPPAPPLLLTTGNLSAGVLCSARRESPTPLPWQLPRMLSPALDPR